MSTATHTPSSNPEADALPLPPEGEPLESILAHTREGLVPSDQLPSAAGVLAEIFPPEEISPVSQPVRASSEFSPAATAGFSAVAISPESNALEESASSQFVPDEAVDSGNPAGEFLENTTSQSSDAAVQQQATAEVMEMADEFPSAEEASISPETDAGPRDSGATKNGNNRKKSVLSGFSAVTGSFLSRVAGVFAGDAKRGASEMPVVSQSEAVEPPAQAESPAVQETSARAEVPIGEQPLQRDSGAESAATSATEPSLWDHSTDRDISDAGKVETSATGIGDARIQHSDDAQRELNASLHPLHEGPGPEQPAFGDSSETDPVYEDEDEIVDTSDDDQAIASAIERYANLTDPARAKALEPAENRAAEPNAQESVVEKADLNTVLGIPCDAGPADSVLGYVVPSAQIPHSREFSANNVATASAGEAEGITSSLPQETSAPEVSDSVTAPSAPARSSHNWSFEEKLASHHEWIESKGAAGRRIDFAGADLEGHDLIGANLRYMDLHDANLRAADLLMADLRDACLVRANFRDSCLVGANLEAANLEGASLETAMGLVPHQLAGANLHEAALPPQILQFDALPEFKRASRTVSGYFAAMMSLSVLSWLIVWTTKDFQLITNSAILRFLHSPAAAAALPTVQFYLIAPFALFIVYLVFHFHLQHLWDTVLELPAVFPDGRTLGENEPRIVVGLLRTHFRWMNQEALSTRVIEKAISILLAYWIVPATLLFYWLRYLTLQEIHGTILQEFLVVGAAGAALYSTTKGGKRAAKWTLDENIVEQALGKLREINPVTTALVLLGMLTFLSAGTIVGVPHDKDRAPQFWSGSIRRWAPTVLWSFGIDPYADLTEAVISGKPENWTGSDEQLSAVKGARLNDSNFRYAQAYRVFLANAHLLHAKFQGAFLSQADLRGADLGQSDLRYAILDQAQMSHANLDRAGLDGADLSRSDLRASNLSYASLAGATLVDARVDGATLYGAKLLSATLIRTNFERADLRESHLDGANLEHADMQGAYLWSAKLPGAHLNNAQLGAAIFVDADLRGADLRWAQLPGTVLTGADITGAFLDGADFRGAVGFGANQICSAKSRKGLLLETAMRVQVTTQCGAEN